MKPITGYCAECKAWVPVIGGVFGTGSSRPKFRCALHRPADARKGP
jgi:hypothetical protein